MIIPAFFMKTVELDSFNEMKENNPL